MRVYMNYRRFGYLLAVIFGAVIFLTGCGTAINYTYDPVSEFLDRQELQLGTGIVGKPAGFPH